MQQDLDAIRKRALDDKTVAKLEEAYIAGWLHNVLSRITPLTLRRRDDYLAMADIFISKPSEAEHVLDRFDSDMELFCSVADIHITKHMTMKTVSEELRSHVELYNDIAMLLHRKFDIELRDPIHALTHSPFMMAETNPFIKEFIDHKFKR